MKNIHWYSDESHILINPRMPNFEKYNLNKIIEEYKLNAHIFLATSGSTAIHSSDIKWVALKKSAILLSAESVNAHLNSSANDVFLNTLPHFHIGGLALFARAKLCGAKIIDIYSDNYKWNPLNFIAQLTENKVTITSLVPTQVFDLVHNNLKAPAFLKTIVVGGGFLNKELYTKAQQLNWPLFPSYGMTECCSQIATAEPNFLWQNDYSELTILPHVKVTLSQNGNIEIASNALLTGYIIQTEHGAEFIDPKTDNKIITSDIGAIKNEKLIVYGRNDENIKINGENVSLIRLQVILEKQIEMACLTIDCAVISLPDARKGHKIAAVFNKKNNKLENIIQAYNEQVFPFERINEIHFLESIPKTELGKLKRNSIALAVGNFTH